MDSAPAYDLDLTCRYCGDDATPRHPGVCGHCWKDVVGHVRGASKLPVDTIPGRRFVTKVDMSGPIHPNPDLGRCWLWVGARNADGYGIFRLDPRTTVRAHVFAFERASGPVPDGCEVDHTCHEWALCARVDDCPHRACVNPAHLAAVSRAVNTLRSNNPAAVNARKTVCDHGHDLVAGNVYVHPSSGRRECATCKRARARAEYVRVSDAQQTLDLGAPPTRKDRIVRVAHGGT